ncbi:helix-turn-helix domain-containing protein [Streptomyces sp. NPDC005423]|uniref:AraC-like ligand-binding domain-containing protein n=1 Tax=Streptomyces sp. NPDC005423 TaxID=3155343 RepID=UPI0033BA53D0
MSPYLTSAPAPALDRDRLADWRETLDRALVPATVTPLGEGPFTGRVTTGRLGCLQVATVQADAVRISRTEPLVARAPGAYVVVGVQASGPAVLTQAGRRAEAAEGDLLVYDTSRPYRLEHPEPFTTHAFRLPRRALALPDIDLRRVTGTTAGTADGVGAVLGPFLTTLAASPHTYSAAVGARLANGVADLLTALASERAPLPAANPDTARGYLVLRIRAHIDRDLAGPGLCAETIAAAHQISVRYLHRLFQDEGITVTRLIQRRRLEESARDLTRLDRTPPTVAAVSRRWGFASPAHFSRTFRTVYGLPPSEWRELRAGGQGGGDGG